MIPNDQLLKRHCYRLQGRNICFGVFDGEGFIGIREKGRSLRLEREIPGAFGQAVAALEDVGIYFGSLWLSRVDEEGFLEWNPELMGYLEDIEER